MSIKKYPLRALFLIVLLQLYACSAQQPAMVNSNPPSAADYEQGTKPLMSRSTVAAGEHGVSRQTAEIQEELSPPEPEQTEAQEVKAIEKLAVEDDKSAPEPVALKEQNLYDFPVVINPQVRYYLNYFQHQHRASSRRWLKRSGLYLTMIKAKLVKAGMPTDLAYLPMIESGYTLTAYSRARAVGLWQFMRSTAINYGLTVNSYVDERRDPIKSTDAAIHYLQALYGQFNSWPLAVAAYNAGEGKIQKAIRRYHSNDFWELARHRYLKAETKRYVPKLIAAIIVSRNPVKYGFKDIVYDKPLQFEEAYVPPYTSLRAVALACGVNFKVVRQLNRFLRRGISPPAPGSYEIRVPPGKAAELRRNLPRVYASTKTRYKTHIVRRHDTIGRICRFYKISKMTLLRANNLRKAKLRLGRYLRIPVTTTRYTLLSKREYKWRLAGRGNGKSLKHLVRGGETLAKIARRYHVTPQRIAAWNGLHNVNQIRAGRMLLIYPGGAAAEQRNIYYQVRGGDSLWTIARKFNTQTDSIKRWNNLKDNLIHPGLKLVLKIADAG